MCAQLTVLLCNSSSNANKYEFFCSANGFGRRLITQLAPSILVMLWQNAVMPLTLYSISLAEGTQLSLSDLDCRILLLFFYWDVFNIFFGGMIGGSVSQQITQFINNPQGITTQLGTAMPSSSNFFINYLALRSFGLVPFRLILPHGGIWRFLFRRAPSPPPPCSLPCLLQHRYTTLLYLPAMRPTPVSGAPPRGLRECSDLRARGTMMWSTLSQIGGGELPGCKAGAGPGSCCAGPVPACQTVTDGSSRERHACVSLWAVSARPRWALSCC